MSKMSFFKNNSYEIMKLFINQVGITIFSLVLYTAAGSIEDEALGSKIRIALSAFAVIFYFALIYSAAWEFGARDKIRIDGGKMEKAPLSGLKMAMIANIPNFIFAFLATLFIGLYIVSETDALYSVFAVFNLIIRFFSAMFLGVIQGAFSFLETSDVESKQFLLYYFWQSVGFLVAPALTVFVTHFGYSLGLEDKRIFGFTSSSNKKK